MNIRKATPKDFDDLLFIEEQAHTHPWPESTLYWCIDQKHVQTFVLHEQKDVAGFAIYECVLDEATLLNIAIHPLLQGQGLGRQLLRDSLLALTTHINTVFLEVRLSNTTAQRLYLEAGFEKVGQRKNYYPTDIGREDALVFSLALDSFRLIHQTH